MKRWGGGGVGGDQQHQSMTPCLIDFNDFTHNLISIKHKKANKTLVIYKIYIYDGKLSKLSLLRDYLTEKTELNMVFSLK